MRWFSAALLVAVGIFVLVNYRDSVWLRGQKRRWPDWASRAYNVFFGLFCLSAGIAIAIFGH
jgi:hypothetical protein